MRAGRQNSGAVLTIVLLVVLVSAAMTAGWVAVMTAESQYVETAVAAAKRRIAQGNGTALARQYLLTNFLTKRMSNVAAVTLDLGSEWGSVAIPGVNLPSPAPPLVPLDVVNPTNGWNHFNPANGAGYAVEVPVAVSGGGATVTRTFLARSRSSALSGSLLIANRSAVTSSVTGGMAVGGQALLWVPNSPNVYQITPTTFNAPSIPVPTVNFGMPVTNFPFIPLTSGDIGGVAEYGGRIDAVANASGINSLEAKAIAGGSVIAQGLTASTANGVDSDGLGKVTINLLHPELENVVIAGETTEIVLQGQSSSAQRIYAGNQKAVLVVVDQTSPLGAGNLTTVNCTLQNNRKVTIAIRKTANFASVALNFADPGIWRGIIALENTPTTITVPGSLTLSGGIQSDRDVAVGGGTLTISPELDPKLLDWLTTRDGWLEVYTP